MKPIIGIVEWPYKDIDGDYIYEVFNNIVEWVVRSGGRPIGIFPTQIENFVDTRLCEIKEMSELEKNDLIETLKMCDGIIKPGALKIYNHERLIHDYTLETNTPYLGICAGMQLMACHGDKTIKTYINETDIDHHSSDTYAHLIRVKKGTMLRSIVGSPKINVNSRHRRHIKNAGDNIVCAKALDGIIEAIENPNCDFNLGLQWHPELLPETDKNSINIFGEFVEKAKTYQKKR